MERNILVSALALGVAGWLCGVLFTRSGRGAGVGLTYALVGAGVVALIALLTVPGRPIWPDGAGWGRGVAIGGITALMAAYVALRARGGDPRQWSAVAASPCFLATAAASAALLWMRATIVETLLGVAAGWFLVSFILFVGALSTTEQRNGPAGALARIPLAVMVLGVGFTSTLCATVALGHFRDVAGPQTTRWSTAALAVSAAVPFVLLLVGWITSLGGRRRAADDRVAAPIWPPLLAAALLASLAYVIAARALGEIRLLYAVGVGLAATLILWWLLSEGEWGAADGTRAAGRSSLQGNIVLPALLALGAVVAGFYLLTGYGTGITLLAAWLPAGIALTTAAGTESNRETPLPESGAPSAAERLVHLLLFGVVVLLYRIFAQRFEDDLSGALLTDHFAIFSILMGALMPSLLTGGLRRPADDRPAPARQLIRLAFTLAAALALPAALLVLWGARAGIGLLTGLMLSVIITSGTTLAALVALSMAIPLAQWAQPALQVAVQTRAEKARLLLWLAGIVVAALLAADYGERFADLKRKRRGRPAVLGVGEGVEL